MSQSIKAALLSALVFPGIGHFSLKKPLQGVVLSGVAIVCLYFVVSASLEIAQQLSVKIQSGEIPMDVAKISETVSQQLQGSDGQKMNLPSMILVIVWVIGIVDSFRIGRLQDKINNSSE